VRIAVTGADSVLGDGLTDLLARRGHQVVALGPGLSERSAGSVEFVEGDIGDAVAVKRAIGGAEVVAHLAWVRDLERSDGGHQQANIAGARNVIAAAAEAGSRRIVFASSPHVYGSRFAGTALTEAVPLDPDTVDGRGRALVEDMLDRSGVEWISVRAALIVGRRIDDWLRQILAAPALFNAEPSAWRPLQVIHLDDVLEVFVRAVLDDTIASGPVNVAASGELSFADLRDVLRRPDNGTQGDRAGALLRIARRWKLGGAAARTELHLLQETAVMDTARLREDWGCSPTWTAAECLEELALAVRGRVTLNKRVVSLPWRITSVKNVPPVDAPAPDGVVPQLAGPQGGNGEFDTPIDARFPTFVATNLSEALPGPFSPAAASVSVLGMRAGGVAIAERMRPGGLIQREIATRTVGIFGHRLYLAITASYFMAEMVPLVKPMTVLGQFFGQRVVGLPVFGAERPPLPTGRTTRGVRTVRSIGIFATNLVGLTIGATHDTADYVDDVDRLERLAGQDLTRLEDRRLLNLISSARDHVVHGWVLVSGSIMLCNAFNVILRGLTGRDIATPAGPGLASMNLLDAVRRLVSAADRDANVVELLAQPKLGLDQLATQAPEFYSRVVDELALIGHRGPGEIELQSNTYADVPELLIQMVAKTLDSVAPQRTPWAIPLHARAVARLSAHHVRDRELRRDKTVRANWVLRRLLREHGRRLAAAGILPAPDDVFFLQVDELAALPHDVAQTVKARRAEQARLTTIEPPPGFSGSWNAATVTAALDPGETLQGLGVSSGIVHGRVRVVTPHNIGELLPGEILVAAVTDVGYTAAFAYAAAAITDLGGLMSHAAIVAREFGIPCVVDAHAATQKLPTGVLVEVDGSTGAIRVLEISDTTNPEARTSSSGQP
jgi:nucleoside-diphosphate-sugar epimerase/phosphohistidine swiveling domain-containing protein